MYFSLLVYICVGYSVKNKKIMRQRLLFLLKIYLWFMFMFMLQKPLFMLFHYNLFEKASFIDWMQVIYHGIPLDLSVASYILALPVFVALVTVWIQGLWAEWFYKGYFALIIAVLSLIFISDIELYTYWGFRMDATPLFYLKSPADAMASVPFWILILGIICIILYFTIFWYPLNYWIVKGSGKWKFCKHRIKSTCWFLLLLGLLFIPIRGGISVSTINVGRVYYSDNMLFNHAAINPAFSLLASLSKGQDFKQQYRFMDADKADKEFSKMTHGRVYFPENDSVRWINRERPDILLIILESFSGTAMEKLGGVPGVMPNLTRLAEEGIFFTNFYANSFRTDRGLVSILSGYPAQPTTSIMKYPVKSQSLPAISKSLRKEGYDIQFLYGGDADFTNMRSYFISSGFQSIVSDKDFPVSDLLSKWGANDGTTFIRFSELIQNQQKHPFMKVFLTLSSHEPFDVPYHHFDDPYLNSVAYTDSCLGAFVDCFRQTPQWNNTLIILVPDHAMRYPAGVQEPDIVRHHIPMVWCGGVVNGPKVINDYSSQIDIAATLLGQMNIDYSDFKFSKNIADTTQYKFAYYTFKDGFGYLDSNAKVIYDNEAGKVVFSEGDTTGSKENAGKAFLQKLYDDLGSR